MNLAEIDAFIALDKCVATLGPWTADRTNGTRMTRVLALTDGTLILPQHVEVTAIAGQGERKAKAQVFWQNGFVIARLEMGNPATQHTNRRPRPADLPPVVHAPHAHLWSDNRRVPQGKGALSRLEFARPVPAAVTGWKEVLIWFLSSCNITIQRHHLPGLPERTALL
jgi:hypothetical protein